MFSCKHQVSFIPDGLRIEALPAPNVLEAGYLPGSRDADVDVVERWLEDDDESTLWIYGIAGVGKSILARHLADLLRRSGQLACLIHVGANSTSSPSLMVKMMAHELAALHPHCRAALAEEVKLQRPQMDGVAPLLEGYLFKPIGSLGAPAPLVFIVDALDEWDHYQTFLKALANCQTSRKCIRFIFTSRLLPDMETAL